MLEKSIDNEEAQGIHDSESTSVKAERNPAHTRAPLQDRHGRTFDYVRIGVIEKCNLRCTYCMPEEGVDFKDKDMVLRTDEIQRTIEVLASMGVKKVRFTGGEPLVRPDIVEIVAAASKTPGIKSTHLTTNGLLFPKYAQKLYDAGLTGVNISLDSLVEEKFERITRRPGLDKVLESIDIALEVGFKNVKVNNVLMRGFNEDELIDFCELTKDKNITVRFIEFMPFDGGALWETGEHFASAADLIGQIENRYPGIADSSGTRTEHHIYRAPGYAGKIAVIPAFTRSLCGNCSRIRVTADGNIMNCLYSEHAYELKNLMRSGASDDDIAARFREAYDDKFKDGFEAKRDASAKPVDISGMVGRTSMTQIGG